MSDLKSRSALSGRQSDASNLAIDIEDITDRGMIDLRGDDADPAFMKAIAGALKIKLPSAPRSSVSGNGLTILWLSPDQWLICCARADVTALLEKLKKALSSQHAFAVDVSDARTILRISGQHAREVLMKGAPVDLTSSEYDSGMVRRIEFAHVAALVHFVSDSPDTIDLFVFRSYAAHVFDWLIQTAGPSSIPGIFNAQQAPAV